MALSSHGHFVLSKEAQVWWPVELLRLVCHLEPVTCTREEEFTLLLVLRYYLLPGISGNAAVLSSAPLPELVHTEGFRRPHLLYFCEGLGLGLTPCNPSDTCVSILKANCLVLTQVGDPAVPVTLALTKEDMLSWSAGSTTCLWNTGCSAGGLKLGVWPPQRS